MNEKSNQLEIVNTVQAIFEVGIKNYSYKTEPGKDYKLNDLYELYIDHSITSGNSENTTEYYKKHLSKIINFLKFKLNISYVLDVDYSSIDKFVKHLKNKDNSNNTINKALVSLKQAYKVAIERNIINRNPVQDYKLLKVSLKDIEIITNDNLLTIFEYFENKKLTKFDMRNKAIFYLMLDTGVRRREVVNIKYLELNLKTNRIRLSQTKNKIPRTVWISKTTRKVLNQYINLIDYTRCEYLFQSDKSEQMTEDSLYRIFYKLKKDLPLPNWQSISPHILRHTCATTMLLNGANIISVQKYLGHKDVSTTMRYLHVLEDEMYEIFQNTNAVESILEHSDKKRD